MMILHLHIERSLIYLKLVAGGSQTNLLLLLLSLLNYNNGHIMTCIMCSPFKYQTFVQYLKRSTHKKYFTFLFQANYLVIFVRIFSPVHSKVPQGRNPAQILPTETCITYPISGMVVGFVETAVPNIHQFMQHNTVKKVMCVMT